MQDLSSEAWIACSQIAGVPILRTQISSFGTLQTGAGMPDGTLQFTAVVGEKATLWERGRTTRSAPMTRSLTA